MGLPRKRSFLGSRWSETAAGRPVFACNEQSIKETREYVEGTGLGATVTFVTIPFRNHNDAWVLRDIPERRRLRESLKQVSIQSLGFMSMDGDGPPARSGALRRAPTTLFTADAKTMAVFNVIRTRDVRGYRAVMTE